MSKDRQRPTKPAGGLQSPRPESDIKKLKCVMVGASGVGKTCVAIRFVKGHFRADAEATIGAAFLPTTVTVGRDTLRFDIWDTAGQDRFRSLVPLYFRGLQAAVVMYDLTKRKTFEEAESWLKEIQNFDSNAIIVLVGNKTDLSDECRQVSSEEGQECADSNKILSFYETSAKTGEGINDIFMDIAGHIIEHGILSQKPQRRPETVRLQSSQSTAKVKRSPKCRC